MCAENHRRAIGHFVQFFNEYRSACPQVLDDVTVVHDFMAYEYRRAEPVEGAFDNFDRAVDTGAETAWIGEQHLHQRSVPGFW